ncbi:VOC family protein [Nocardia abscessus]|uniref:VOC family protein n=1 Tax=Nocardia abscessus TaxID=120957 RepID=UPI001894428A|nr:VOC family protein [Nocardia abscessus]MBF6339477.1 VOC family protein [Nocardia abscessus]
MTTKGIEGVHVETHNWGKTARFFLALGYEPEFTTDHNSGMFRNGDGPYVFIAEIPNNRTPRTQLILTVTDADAFPPDSDLDVVTPFEATHYGTKEMTVRDPDGRTWSLQAQG